MKMKLRYVALFIGIFISIPLWSQLNISGKVIDSDTRLPIEYATIFNVTSKTGLFTTEKGNFRIAINQNDTLEVSCVGYKTMRLSNLNQKNNEFSISLDPLSRALQEVVVSNINWAKYKERKAGYAGIKSNWHVGGKTGLEYAVYIPNQNKIKDAFVVELNYKMEKWRNDSVLVRLHIYTVSPIGSPGEELLDSNVIKLLTGKMKKQISYDISNFKIRFPENGLFVGIEWLGVYDPTTNTMISQEAFEPMVGFNDNINELITYTKSPAGNWEKRDLRSLYIHSSIENRVTSKNNPNASFGIILKIPK